MASDRLTPQVQEQLLEQLRDLDLPTDIGWWPPAPGWWLLGAIALVALAWLIWYLRSRPVPNRYHREATTAMTQNFKNWQEHGDDVVYTDNAANIMRQIAIHLRGRESTAGLTGPAWSAMIEELGTEKLSQAVSDMLTESRYRSDPSIDVEAVHADLTRWLNSVKAARHV